MKILFISIFFSLFLYQSFSQDVNALLIDAAKLENIPNESAALIKFKEVLLLQPDNIHALYKCSELCSRIGSREKNTTFRDKWFNSALIYAKTALKIDPNNDEANVCMAMILGKTSLTKSGKEKISIAKDIKKHLDIALKTNHNNYLAWHILGRWCYELGNINAIERGAAKLFYGGIPQATIKDAIMYFEKARTIKPLFILNYIELAKAYHKDGQDEKAIKYLTVIQTFPINTEDDIQHKAEALNLIKAWK